MGSSKPGDFQTWRLNAYSKKLRNMQKRTKHVQNAFKRRILLKMFVTKRLQQFEKNPAVKKYVDEQIAWFESSGESATTEELNSRMQELQKFLQAEVQKSGANPHGAGSMDAEELD